MWAHDGTMTSKFHTRADVYDAHTLPKRDGMKVCPIFHISLLMNLRHWIQAFFDYGMPSPTGAYLCQGGVLLSPPQSKSYVVEYRLRKQDWLLQATSIHCSSSHSRLSTWQLFKLIQKIFSQVVRICRLTGNWINPSGAFHLSSLNSHHVGVITPPSMGTFTVSRGSPALLWRPARGGRSGLCIPGSHHRAESARPVWRHNTDLSALGPCLPFTRPASQMMHCMNRECFS